MRDVATLIYINATWDTNEQKGVLLTMTESFTVMVETERIYSWLERPHTLKSNYKVTQWQALILDFFSLFPISCVFSLLNLTTLIWIILFGIGQESNYVVAEVSCVSLNCI